MGFHSKKNDEPVSEINVTPLVDVMLVLLVIFMVTAPMMFNGINLNLPKTKKSKSINVDDDVVILSINAEGRYFIGSDEVFQDRLVSVLSKVLSRSNKETVFLRADSELKYGLVAKTMGALKAGGIGKISLITELESN